VIEGGLETINATALTSNNCEVLCDAASKLSLFSVDTVTKNIMVFYGDPISIEKTSKEFDKCNTMVCVASLALCNLRSGRREQKELLVKQGILCVLLFLLRFSNLEVERCALLASAQLQFNV
jgi:hypothetical protein